VLWLQGITLASMAIEAGISLYAASTSRSIALLAFGSDSLVELLSACVVLLSFGQRVFISRDRAARWAGILLFILAGIVASSATRALSIGVAAEVSPSGIAIAVAALLVMPVLAWFKRKTGKKTGNRALTADAVQSATCAYLAAITLVGLLINAAFHIRWIDSVAALMVLPILLVEGKRALRGDPCTCC
jgi:divalent metal cation (Fe/Co/Zn/Cd) transporter